MLLSVPFYAKNRLEALRGCGCLLFRLPWRKIMPRCLAIETAAACIFLDRWRAWRISIATTTLRERGVMSPVKPGSEGQLGTYYSLVVLFCSGNNVVLRLEVGQSEHRYAKYMGVVL